MRLRVTITRIHKILHSHSFTRRPCKPGHQLRNSQCEYPTTRRIPYTKFILTVANASSPFQTYASNANIGCSVEIHRFLEASLLLIRLACRVRRIELAGSQLITSYRTYSNGIITLVSLPVRERSMKFIFGCISFIRLCQAHWYVKI